VIRTAALLCAALVLGSCLFRPSTHNAKAVVQSADTSVRDIRSGRLFVRLEVGARDVPLSGFQLTGPFAFSSSGELPAAQLDATRFDGGRKQTGTFVSTGTQAYATVAGRTIPLTAEQTASLRSVAGRSSGLDLQRLMTGKRTVKAGGLVGTVTTNEVTADLDAPSALRGLTEAARSLGIGRAAELPVPSDAEAARIGAAVKAAKISVWTGRDDGKLRKVVVDVEFYEDGRGLAPDLQRLAGVTLHLEASIMNLNESVSVPAPSAAAPASGR
jgi:hypothetical protein